MGDVTYIDPGNKNLASVGDSFSDVIHCLMISLTEETILLPNTAIAEVVDYIQPEALDGAPNWFLGRIPWRERLVPLISLEIATLSTSSDSSVIKLKGTRIAILNTLNGNEKTPYIAIVSQGIPSLSVISNDDIASVEVLPANRQSIAEIVSVAGQEFIIPDIDDLENRILNIH